MAHAVNTTAWTHEEVVAFLADFAASQPTKAKAAPASNGGLKAGTKKHAALMLVTEAPVTTDAIATALGVTKAAAVSLIGDLRRAGYKLALTDAGYALAA